MQLVRDIVMRLVVRKTAEKIVERSCKDLIAQAAKAAISVHDIREVARESMFDEEIVGRNEGRFPRGKQ